MYETVLFMQSTRRVPYIGLQGGGVPAGGTMHAGHAYWQSTITPVSAAPQRYPAPPQPSLYVTPFPRDLPSIVAKPYKVLKGGGIKDGVKLEDGFAPVAVVGAPSLAELYADENMGRTDLETTQAASRRAMFRMQQDSESGGYQFMNADTSMGTESNQASDQQPGLTRQTGALDINSAPRGSNDMDRSHGSRATSHGNTMDTNSSHLRTFEMPNPWAITQSPAGHLVAPQYVSRQPNDSLTPLPTPTDIRVSKQRPVSALKDDNALNHSDTLFNVYPLSLDQNLKDAFKMNSRGDGASRKPAAKPLTGPTKAFLQEYRARKK